MEGTFSIVNIILDLDLLGTAGQRHSFLSTTTQGTIDEALTGGWSG